ncbi:MAG TPA: cell surface protein SprA, partial [Flavobacteriaceae bacterium]|nr:cell surface protein SprA [Flavobacteriaceae bacterium]
NASNNRIVNNFIDDAGLVNNDIGIWDGFFNIGEPNHHFQTLQVNYDLPFNKIPFLRFVRATYAYTGDYQWQKGSELFKNAEIQLLDGTTGVYDLGNTIQNSNSHRINSTLDMNSFYRYIGLKKKQPPRQNTPGGAERRDRLGSDFSATERSTQSEGEGEEGGPTPRVTLSAGDKALNTVIGLVTSIKRAQFNYQENNGIFMPGYTPSIGFMGSLRPSVGFVFGGQGEIRELAARNGWLTLYPEFNEQYTEVETKQMDYQINTEPFSDLKIDFSGNRMYSESFAENYIVTDGQYRSLAPRMFGNFNISTIMIGTAFSKSDGISSETFEDFRANRQIIADRLARQHYGTDDYPVTDDGYPVGFGRNSQAVLLPSFIAAYEGRDVNKVNKGIFRDVPLPNWDLRYTGLMRLEWFKKHFKRFSIQHGYRSGYTVNQFQTNLDYNRNNPEELDQAGNFKEPTLVSNVNLIEQFSPLIKVDFETKNAFRILAEVRRDRALSLSFANSLLTEIQGQEYIVGFGYRIKDLTIGTNLGGNRQVMKSDLNFKVDLSIRDNITIIRYLDIMDTQVTAGQTIYGIQLTADYALSRNLTALFYYDHTFSEYAISTAFPQTTIRTGITLRYVFGN